MENAFVNCSKQLDNLLLDGMEPFDLNGLTEFEFGYVAGHHVKTPDINGKDLEQRVCQEVEECYTPAVRKTLETKAVSIKASAESAITMPVLLPVYYICKGDLMAAVNGQTGKVSVRALKESHYYFLPWWLKAIFATLVISGAAFGGMYLLGMNLGGSLLITAMLAFVFFVVLLCLYSDTTKNSFSVEAGREIYTSGDATFHRERGKLVQSDDIPSRVIRMILLSIVALFLPVIVALFLTGFDFQKINLGGSAVWFCIAVPVVPIYLLKFGIVELHDRPWIYVLSKDGKKKRYRPKPNADDVKDVVFGFLRALIIPPISLAVWFGILSFCVMVYLTAGGT